MQLASSKAAAAMQACVEGQVVRLFDGGLRTQHHSAQWGLVRAELATFKRDDPARNELLLGSHVLIGGINGNLRSVDITADGSAPWQGPKAPGSAAFYPAGRRMRSLVAPGDTTVLTLFIGPEATNELLGESKSPAWQTRASAEDSFVSAALQGLAAVMSQGSDSLAALLAETLATSLHLHAVSRFSDRRFELPAGSEGLGRVLDLIHSELPHSVSLERMAEAAGMPRGRFLVAFRSRTGVSPHQYILRERLARAKSLLETTRRPLHEIAAEVGCANPGHLARMFRQHLDTSPRAWRHGRDRS